MNPHEMDGEFALPTATGADLCLWHLQAELARIDVLLQREVRRWQLAGQDAEDGFRGLYVPDVEVHALLARPLGATWGQMAALDPAEEQAFGEAWESAVGQAEALAEAAAQQGDLLRLPRLAATFGLDRFDVDALLICLAPELDLRYERIYGYLQDDVTKKRPSVDLVLNLLCPSLEAKLAMRERFTAGAPLIENHLLSVFQDPSQPQPPLLSQYLKVDERIVSELLGANPLDARLLPYAQLCRPRGPPGGPALAGGRQASPGAAGAGQQSAGGWPDSLLSGSLRGGQADHRRGALSRAGDRSAGRGRGAPAGGRGPGL